MSDRDETLTQIWLSVRFISSHYSKLCHERKKFIFLFYVESKMTLLIQCFENVLCGTQVFEIVSPKNIFIDCCCQISVCTFIYSAFSESQMPYSLA